MNFIIAPAYAQGGAAAPAGGFEPLIMLAIFGLIFYFLIWRPQSKRGKEHKGLLAGLAKGDEVITGGGLAGKITKVSEDGNFVVVEIAQGVEVKVQKAAVANVLPKGTLKAV